MKLTAVYENRGDWIIGYVEELPGALTQGKTLKEVRKNLKEAVQLIIESHRKHAEKHLSKKHLLKIEPLLVKV